MFNLCSWSYSLLFNALIKLSIVPVDNKAHHKILLAVAKICSNPNSMLQGYTIGLVPNV